MPYLFYWRIKERVRGRSDYPLSMLWLEFRGYLAGPWAYWRSRQRVKREGKSTPYQLPKERTNAAAMTAIEQGKGFFADTLHTIPLG
jgi:hypothetical protein